MRPAVPLSYQLLLTFVGLLVGITIVLTRAANSSLLTNLADDARRDVALATRTREQALTQLFQLRQQRAVGFLVSVASLCGEPLQSGRVAWVDDCVRTMVDDFRRSERAVGALLTYRTRRLRRSGRPVSSVTVPSGALTKVVRRGNGAVEYVMNAKAGETALVLQFDHSEVARLFADQSDLGRSGDVFLLDSDGQFLTPRRNESVASADQAISLARSCRFASESFVDSDYRGVRSFQSFRPIGAFGAGCVVARVGYNEVIAPARRLPADLVERAAWFVLVGAILSIVAARWISAPVRRLAVSARNLQNGRFDRPMPLAGPLEVRALGQAFNAMGNELAELVAREQAARREAEAANHSKDDFLATVSHELRTPLTAVLGWTQMLKSGRLSPDEVQHALDVIERSAGAQRQMIEELLDVSRIVSNRLRIVREPIRLAEVVDAALDAVRPEAAAKQVEIETELDEAAVVLGDPQRLEQVVWNLAWNAIKFTQRSGRITVKLSRDDRYVTLSVEDTGAGISAAFLPHVFDWFRQAEPRLRSQSGLGLGLGIVRRLVQLHGGRVRAESRGEGHGATFIVTLPVHEAAARAVSSPPGDDASPRPLKNRLDDAHVLVVEDDDQTREFVRLTLETAGASVAAVATANDARRQMSTDSPDVLVSDIRMPEEDGYSLVRSLRRLGITTPAIALTAYSRQEDAEEAQAAGFQIHLPKPVEADRLIDAVATLFQGHGDTIH
jgi:signal transduction histidine kinase/ActR/RegA family two-component response regulator